MKGVLTGALALLCQISAAQPLLAQTAPAAVALTGGRVIASPDASPVDATVVIEGGNIVAVGARGRVTVPAGATTIDCTGLFVVAGFQNSHVHFTEEKWADAKTQPAATLAAQLEAMLTRYGFTTAVDTASWLPNTVELRWRSEIEAPGPRILTAGLALYPPNGVPYYVKDAVPPQLLKLLPQPSTPADAIDAVRRNVEGGANLIKLFTGSWVSRGQVVMMPADVAAAAVDDAHRRSRLVFAHPSNVAGLEVALAAHVDVLAHVVEAGEGLTPNHLKRMKSQDMALVPTLKLLADDGAGGVRALLDQVRDFAKVGGQILFGTDVGYLSDYNPSREYVLMEAAGLTWRQILASLTTNPAARFKESSRRGRVARGMEADIVVLGTDPALGANAFTDVRYVIRAGRMIYRRQEAQ
ncbi:MAG: amidohydrolase family protein [Vicinamibacterales bacterium]|nr:amidohydrolase family protein [Vicinamibacterales bacterium]